MRNHHYTFVSTWHIPAPLTEVWQRLIHIEAWPQWWKGVEHTHIRHAKFVDNGVGSMIDSTWKSWLPYRIHFTLTITEVVIGSHLVAHAQGDLEGTGRWDFSESGGVTTAVYTWKVATTKPWMNAVAPIARPIFAHAHDTVMHWGEEGLNRLLRNQTTLPESHLVK